MVCTYKRLKNVKFVYSVFFGWVYEIWNHSIRIKIVIMSDTTRRGTLSKNRKYCLSLAKIKAKGQLRGLGRFSDSPKACAKASDERPKPSAPPRPSRRGPAPQGLGWDVNSPIRSRLGSATTSSSPPQSAPQTKRHVQINAPNYSRNVSRTLAQFGQNA